MLHKGCHEVVDVECGESGESPDPDTQTWRKNLDKMGLGIDSVLSSENPGPQLP